jgi:hypothetical protein
VAADACCCSIGGDMHFMLSGPDGQLAARMLDQIEVAVPVPGAEAVG